MKPTKKSPGPYDGLPMTLSVDKVLHNEQTANRMARRRGAGINFSALTRSDDPEPPPASTDAAPPTTAAEREAEVRRRSYLVSDTTPSKVDLNQDLPGYMRLEAAEILSYDSNPRIFENEARDEIRQSLLANGFQGAFVVTRRGPGQPYMLAAGSNTTLELVKALYVETQDERYRWVDCIYQPYEGEVKVLAQHLGENLNRGGMKFWEVAKGTTDLLTMIEAERAGEGASSPLGGREAAEQLAARGIKVSRSTVQIYRFAIQRLKTLGQATECLKLREVQNDIQPRLAELESLSRVFDPGRKNFWESIVDPTLERIGQDYASGALTEVSAAQIVRDVQLAFAHSVGETNASLTQILTSFRLNPTADLGTLRAPSPSIIVGVRIAEAPDDDEATQQNLALGPTVIRDRTASPPAPAAPVVGATRPTASSPHAGAAATPAPQPTLPVSQPAPVQAPLIAPSGTEAAPSLQSLHLALRDAVRAAEMEDVLAFCDTMPLGYFIELPDPERHRRVMVTMNSPEDELRQVKRMTWWTLAYLSGQWTNEAANRIDQNSRFYQHHAHATQDTPDALAGLDMEGEPQSIEALMRRVSPGPYRDAMHRLRHVESLMAEVYEAEPERWKLMQLMQLSNSAY